MLDEQNVGALMHDEAAAPAPPSTVDVGRAVRAGRRRRRVRLAAGGGVAAVTALAVFGGVAVAQGLLHGRSDQRPPAARPAAAPAAFDPMVRTVDLGYLPAGLEEGSFTVSATSQVISYLHYGSGPDGGRAPVREVDVAVFTPDGVNDSSSWWWHQGLEAPAATPNTAASPTASPGLTIAGGDLAGGATGPRVAGGPSYWQRSLPASADESILAWHWAPRAWAYVRVVGYGGQATGRPVAARVAAAVRTGPRQRVTVPFTVRRPPARLPLRETTVFWDGATFGATLSFARDASMTASGNRSEKLLISSQSDTRTGGPPNGTYANPNTTIAGHQAYSSYDDATATAAAGTGLINVYGVAGQTVTVEVDDAVTARYVTAKQATALAASVTVVPGVADRANWTTDPLR